MSSYEILHEVGIAASPQAIFEALTDKKKLAAWWTSDTRGDGAKVGGVLEFWFGDFCQKFEVTDLQPGRYVKWKASQKETMDEWAGTEIRFKLCPEDEQCMVAFSHSGWRDSSGMLPHCSTKWAVFLVSLKELLEKGKGRPAPDDIEINHY
jgi:uncharacterized protein YndB with AHSA1/START domain